MTAQPARRRFALADDSIIDPIAVELAAASILARGGSTYHIATRLHVSGTTALTLAARCQP